MKSIEKKIIKAFTIELIGLYLIMAALDSIFEHLMNGPWGREYFLALVSLNIALSIGVLALRVLMFSKNMKKLFKEEAELEYGRRNMLFASIAHDMKTPMTSVLGYSRALRDGMITPEQQGECFALIAEKAGEMNTLLEDMFEYSKRSSEDFPLQLERCELSELVRRAVSMDYDEIERAGARLELRMPQQEVEASVDSAELTRLLNNLIRNAVRHNPQGVEICVGLESYSLGAKIYVADDGELLSAEAERSLFDPFYKGDASRNEVAGSGLGLAISQRIAQLHSGSISYEEGFAGYSKAFVLRLPAADLNNAKN